MRITIRDLITESLHNCEAVSLYESPTGKEIDDGLDCLNTFIESLFQESIINFQEEKMLITTDSSGEILFYQDPLLAITSNSKPFLTSNITKVISTNSNYELIKIPNGQLSQLIYDQTKYSFNELPGKQIINTHLVNQQLSINYIKQIIEIDLDTKFLDVFPRAYWGLLSDGLAVQLGSIKYKTDVSALIESYKGRLNRIENKNFNSGLANTSNYSNFNSGWF
jgi:hypothetical protein